eukprot:scaffold8141_cov139-Skeletonema_dohrnii-CCMP3373.AAC.19
MQSKACPINVFGCLQCETTFAASSGFDTAAHMPTKDSIPCGCAANRKFLPPAIACRTFLSSV